MEASASVATNLASMGLRTTVIAVHLAAETLAKHAEAHGGIKFTNTTDPDQPSAEEFY